jgi:hypothetical protein
VVAVAAVVAVRARRRADLLRAAGARPRRVTRADEIRAVLAVAVGVTLLGAELPALDVALEVLAVEVVLAGGVERALRLRLELAAAQEA